MTPATLASPSATHTLPEQLVPASTIIAPSPPPLDKDKQLLCYRVAIQTIRSIRERQYSHFDAITTSNCCHGVALRAHELIKSLDIGSLELIERDLSQAIIELESETKTPELNIPETLAQLSKLFLLNLVREESKKRGGLTSPKNLCQIVPSLSKSQSKKIIKMSQHECANQVAKAYQLYPMSAHVSVNSQPTSLWGKYVTPPFLRTNEHQVSYASNLFSMEVVMAHLIETLSIVALVNDLKDASGEVVKGRYVQLLRGNGRDNFIPLTSSEAASLDSSIPVIVFGGCSHSDQMDIDGLTLRLSSWIDDFPKLVLANDLYYPQFPKGGCDPYFDSSPISPEEDELLKVIQGVSAIDGVSTADPSLFFLAHIYTTSLHEVRENSLPISSVCSNITHLTPNAALLE